MAIDTLPDGFADKLIHHSDRGCQYASADYINRLTKNNITPSMTESGNPKDNAMAERINNTVKNELLHGKTFTSIRQVVEALDDAIEFYNQERPHSSLDWHTPNEAHEMTGEMKNTGTPGVKTQSVESELWRYKRKNVYLLRLSERRSPSGRSKQESVLQKTTDNS